MVYEGAMNGKIQVWKVRPKEGGPWLIVEALSELEEVLTSEANAERGWELQRSFMTQEEFNNIGDFDGW